MNKMQSLVKDCLFSPLTTALQSELDAFSCGNEDLDDFFRRDSSNYAVQLMGKSYCFMEAIGKDEYNIVGAFTVSNDSIKVYDLRPPVKNRLQRRIPNTKRMRSYPAVLIGRLGIDLKYQGLHLGDQLLLFIKRWFIHPDNKTGCRYIVVDAYNTPKTINYYQRNGFTFLYEDEADERNIFKLSSEAKLRTRLMFYDLMTFKED